MNEEKNRRVYMLGIGGVVVLLATVTIFMIVKPEQCYNSVFLGLLFFLAAEVVFFGGLIGLEFMEDSSQIVARSGCGFCIIGYALAGGVTSLLYMIMNTNAIRMFLIIQIILIVVCTVLFFAFRAFSHEVWEKDNRTLSSVKKCDELVQEFIYLQKNTKYGKQFNELAEQLKYTDCSVDIEADGEIKQVIAKIKQELEKDPYSDKIADYISSVSELIKKRKYQIKNKKNGGI